MLNILCGDAKSGKTGWILKEMGRLAQQGRPSLLIVPENASHQAERRLLTVCGNSVARYAQVTTFSKLTEQLLQAAGRQVSSLDAGGRVLYMHRALLSVQSQLQYYKNPSQRPQLIGKLLQLCDELKVCRVTPEALLQAAQQDLSPKICDLSLIYMAYCANCEKGNLDPHDRTALAAESIVESGMFDGVEVFIDHFAGFTAEKYDAIGRILSCAAGVTVALLMGRDPLVFTEQYKTRSRLQALAQQCSVPCQVILREDHGARTDFTAGLFDYSVKTAAAAQRIALYLAQDAGEECELVAALMRQLLLEDKVRARQIMVVCPDADDYGQRLEVACRRYGVPLFVAQKQDIVRKPALMAVLGALEAVEGGMQPEAVFAYLKSGLCGIDPDLRDRLENYVYLWRLSGKAWFAPFTLSTAGYAVPAADEAQKLEEVNAVREQVAAQLQPLRQALSESRCGAQYAAAMREHIVRIDLEQRLQARIDQLQQSGSLRQAAEYAQLYDILNHALDQFAAAMAEVEMDTRTFLQLLRLTLAQYDVATIPPSLDSVQAGSFDRLYGDDIRCLLVLGGREGLLPPAAAESSLLTESERIALEGAGVELTQTQEERSFENLSAVYRVLTMPSEDIVFTAPRQGSGGEECRVSYLLHRLQQLMPDVIWQQAVPLLEKLRLTAPAPALEAACSVLQEEGSAAAGAAKTYLEQQHGKGDWFRSLQQYAKAPRGPIRDPEVIRKLYGDTISMTASRLEKVSSCRFSYFMQYGLKAAPRKQARFGAPEVGTFVHYIVEHSIRQLCTTKGLVLEQVVRHWADEFIRTQLGGTAHTARFQAMLRGFYDNVTQIVRNIYEEIENSDFKPMYFELDFSRGGDLPPLQVQHGQVTLSVNGKIDRVDGYVKDDRLYLKVVDYKTGKKSFQLSDVLYGLNLQMFLYLSMLSQSHQQLLQQDESPVAGTVESCAALYIPAKNPYIAIEPGESEAAARDKLEKELRRIGIVPSDDMLLQAMEHSDGRYRFLPVQRKKDGGFTAQSCVASAEQMGRLLRHTGRVLEQLAEQIADGDIEANPYRIGKQFTVCQWCDYKTACHFDPSMQKDRLRCLPQVGQQQVHEIIREEESRYGH